MPQQDDYLATIPVGKLGIIALESSKGIAKKVDDYIVDWREARNHEHTETIHFNDYKKDSYLVTTTCPRFGTGEAKGMISAYVQPMRADIVIHGIKDCIRHYMDT